MNTSRSHDNTSIQSYLAIIHAIIKNVLQSDDFQMYLFGSFAQNKSAPSSDIDIAITSTQPLAAYALALVRDQLEESTIPYHVDIVDLRQVNEKLREAVQRQGILWQG